MIDNRPTPAARLADAVADYRTNPDVPKLLSRLRAVSADADPDTLAAAVEPFRDIPEVAGPIYETIVAKRPGPDVVGALASRAIAADAGNRGAWHLWALTAEKPRERMNRWEQVAKRFTEDDLAKAALADNAASVAGSDDDPVAKQLAIDTFTDLLGRAKTVQQRSALENALSALRA